MGTVLGPHVPSPLGRVLRMPAVPFSVLADPPFAVVEDIVVARAFVAAAERRLAEPVNVVANGAITALQAARRGPAHPASRSSGRTGRSPALISGLLGAPIPDHVLETFHRGRLADNGRMERAARVHVADDHRSRSSTASTSGRPSCAPRPGGRSAMTDTDVRGPGASRCPSSAR